MHAYLYGLLGGVSGLVVARAAYIVVKADIAERRKAEKE